MIKSKTFLSPEFVNFLLTYGLQISTINNISNYTINLMECQSDEFMKTYNKNSFYNDFATDIASPYFIINEGRYGCPNEISVYRITDWCNSLSNQDNNALLLHEFGHIDFTIQNKKANRLFDEEIYADSFASQIIGNNAVKQALLSMLNLPLSSQDKVCINNRIALL